MSDDQSNKEIYYEEVLTTAALALSNSKTTKGPASSSKNSRDNHGARSRLQHSPYSGHRYAHSDSYNVGNKLRSFSSNIKSDHHASTVTRTGTATTSSSRSDGGSNSVWDRDLPTCHGLMEQRRPDHVLRKIHNDVGSNSDNGDNKRQPNISSEKMGRRCDSMHQGSHKDFMTPTEAELLASLPSRPIANFPSESDRKRVIGMLATIISTMYQYEEDDGVMDYSPRTQQQEDEEDEEEEEEEDQPAIVPPITGNDASFHSVPGIEYNDGSSTMNDDSFDDLWKQSHPVNTKSEESQAHAVNDNRKLPSNDNGHQSNNHRYKRNNNRLLSRSQSSSFHSQQSQLQNTIDQFRQESIIAKRYRQRRHFVYSNFLVSASGFLFLDKSNAIAFLPLLNKMLGANDNDENEMIESWNRHGTSSKMYGKAGDHGRTSVCNKEYGQQSSKENRGSKEKEVVHKFDSNTAQNTNDRENQPWYDNDILTPFVESLEPGAGVQCLSLLLLNYLLQSQDGYDARIRACLKKLGVIIFSHELKNSDCEDVEERIKVANGMGKTFDDCLTEMATRKFESLEHTIALKLLRISAAQQQRKQGNEKVADNAVKTRREITREKILRGLKIGTAGVAAGTLMAVTGGLAAPGIAAGLAATGITTAATAGVVTTLTSTAAVTTIFGVGGGGLAAYKTHRRTKGVTEFTFQKQQNNNVETYNGNAELFTTICISGWLKDNTDFERPWGVEPSNPPITDKLEKLVRFYSIHKPENIERCQEILKRWKGEEKELWAVLREKYGQDPDHLYPIYSSPNKRIVLTHEEDEVVDRLLGELGYRVPHEECDRSALREVKQKLYSMNVNESSISMRSPRQSENVNASFSTAVSDSDHSQHHDQDGRRHTNLIWDYQMEYGGELVTVKWESEMLVELCDSVADMAAGMVGQAAREILKQTAFATLITAVALPYAIVRAADMIDGTWTLAIERSDLAGIELAKSLLESEAGHRPVVLIGFSMGARVIYSCLKELARQQEIWEEQEEGMRTGLGKGKEKRHRQKFAREPASIVEDAIIMGLPNHLSLHSWESCRRIVAGRLVNCYSKKDMILSLMFQIKRLTGALRPVCGTSPVRVKGVENYNVERLISAHSDYCVASGHILRMIYHGTPHRSSASIVVPSHATNHGFRMT